MYPRRLVTRTTWPTPNDDIDFRARQVAGMHAACLTLVWLCSCFKYRIDITFWASVKLHSHGNMFVPPPRMNPDVTCYYTREQAILDHSILVSVSCEILKTKGKRKKWKKNWPSLAKKLFLCAYLALKDIKDSLRYSNLNLIIGPFLKHVSLVYESTV